jgi:uncharacterized protein (TIGR03083 family)
MMGTTREVEAIRDQRSTTLRQLTQLEPAEWDVVCLPPWRVRDVVAHLVAIDEAAVSGRLLPLLREASGRADIERWNDVAVLRWADEPVSELVDALERLGSRLVVLAERIPGSLWRVPARTVFGRHPLGFLLARRVLDEWVHVCDIAAATGRDIVVPDGGADMLATAVLDALPTFLLPNLEPTVGVVRLVVHTGPIGDDGEHAPRRTWAVDFARRHYGPRVTARPDATVRMHAAALALRVEGRSATGPLAAVDVDGDADLAGALLDGLVGSSTRL